MSDKTNLSNSMNEQYQLTKQIHAIIPKLAEKYGKKINIKNDKILYVDTENWTGIEECTLGVHSISIDAGVLDIREHQFGRSIENYNDWIPKIEELQIRQILLAVKDELGDNPEYAEMLILKNKYADATNVLCYPSAVADEYKMKADRLAKKIAYEILLEKTIVYKSEALCNKWLDGLTPLFDSEPVIVLKELLEILENLLTNK